MEGLNSAREDGCNEETLIARKNAQEASRYFEKRATVYGDSHITVDWGSRSAQEARFEALSQVTTLHNSSLLDVGCGLGHLIRWASQQGIDFSLYEGIDITPSMVASAKELFPEHRFSVCNIGTGERPTQECYDIVFASGIFYLAAHQPYEYVEMMSLRMLSYARKAAVFNILTKREITGEEEGKEFRASMQKLISVIERITTKYRIDHSYSLHDATIAVYK